MRRILIMALICLPQTAGAEHDALTGRIYAPSSAARVKQLNQAAGVLSDPTVIPQKFAQSLNQEPGNPVRNNAGASTLPTGPRGISDPTQMNGSFSAALKRLSVKGRGSAGGALKLPQINLAAKSLKKGGKQASAFLDINQQLYFVKPGESFSFMQDNTIYEIAVESIDNHAVRVRLYPMNELLILR